MTFVLLLLLATAAPPATAKLATVDTEAFARAARCVVEGVVVRVTFRPAVAAFGDAVPLPDFELAAEVRVEEVWRGTDCPRVAAGGTVEVLFSREVHSSKPAAGERAVLALRRQDGRWLEAVYGRSYWQLVPSADGPRIGITWRNDFLLPPETPDPPRVVPYAQVRQTLEALWRIRGEP